MNHRALLLRLLEAYDAGDQPLYAETFREIERSHKEAEGEIRARRFSDTRLVKLMVPSQPAPTS